MAIGDKDDHPGAFRANVSRQKVFREGGFVPGAGPGTLLTQRYADDLDSSAPQKPQDLSHTDQKLLTYIESNPGCTVKDLEAAFDWSHGTARYYRNKLARRNLVYCDREDHPHRHYASPEGFTEEMLFEMRMKSHLKDPKRAKILEWLQDHLATNGPASGWATVNAISEKLGVSRDFVINMAGRFEDLGVVETRSMGSRYEVRATRRDLFGQENRLEDSHSALKLEHVHP